MVKYAHNIFYQEVSHQESQPNHNISRHIEPSGVGAVGALALVASSRLGVGELDQCQGVVPHVTPLDIPLQILVHTIYIPFNRSTYHIPLVLNYDTYHLHTRKSYDDI